MYKIQVFLNFSRFSFILLLCLSGTAAADVYNCNGVWSSNPCAGGTASSVINSMTDNQNQAEKFEKTSPAAQLYAEKKFALAELDRLIFDAKRKLNQDLSMQTVETYCLTPETTLVLCQAAIDKRTTEINLLLQQQQKPNVQITDNKQDNRVIVIQNNNLEDDYYRPPGGWPPGSRPPHPRPHKDPTFQEGPFAGGNPYRSKER